MTDTPKKEAEATEPSRMEIAKMHCELMQTGWLLIIEKDSKYCSPLHANITLPITQAYALEAKVIISNTQN